LNFWANGRKDPSTFEIYINGPWDFQNLKIIKMVLGDMKLSMNGPCEYLGKIPQLTLQKSNFAIVVLVVIST
jgi:hypothetical protein